MGSRTTSYSIDEDKLLCSIYLDISQNPIIGINQSSKTFWYRIEVEYHKALPEHMKGNIRPLRSLQNRMQHIKAAINKLRGCIRQIENLNPSGASEQDILDRAKGLLAQDPKFSKGFKFDHLWPIMKNTQMYMDVDSNDSPSGRKRTSRTEASQSDSNANQGMSAINIDLNEEFDSVAQIGDSSARPIGRNNAKMKKKQSDEHKEFIKTIQEENMQFKKMFEESSVGFQNSEALLKQHNDLQERKLKFKERKHEDKILLTNLEAITNSAHRKFIEGEQQRIYAKRIQEQQQDGGSNTSNDSNQHFGGLGEDDYYIPQF